MFMRTNEPIADFHRHDAEQERKLKKMPVCCGCGEHIQEEFAIRVNEKWYCEDCESDAWDEVRHEYLVRTSET